MHSKNFGLFCLFIGLSGALKAQLNERFEVTQTGPVTSDIQNNSQQPISCEAAEKLVLEGCSLEAAIMFSELIVHYHFLKDITHLDRACEGLYRTQLITKIDSKYTNQLALCRPEVLALFQRKAIGSPCLLLNPFLNPMING